MREHEFRAELVKSKAPLERCIGELSAKRDARLAELSEARLKVHNSTAMQRLKARLVELTDAEMSVETSMSEMRAHIEDTTRERDELERRVEAKRAHASDDGRTFDELRSAENEMIERARHQLAATRAQQASGYALIESEFEKARQQMLAELEANDAQLAALRAQRDENEANEHKLRTFLSQCLYENDEEKCLVENELTDLIEVRENVEVCT